MENFLNLFNDRKLEVNEKGKLKQNVRNAMKAELMVKFGEFLEANGVENLQVRDGLVLEFANEELGAVAVMLNLVMKDLDFDVLGARDEFLVYRANQEAKAKAKAEKSAQLQKEKAE